MFEFHYCQDKPLIDVDRFPELGGNINGPTLIRAPDWLEDAPGRYLLYFAHHEGRSIRLAYSDELLGPWRLYDPHPLTLEQSLFAVEAPADHQLDPAARAYIEAGADGNYPHIASPDIWVDEQAGQLRLYYHGRLPNGLQVTRVAVSTDGINFRAREAPITDPYLRVFRHRDWFYGLAMPARLYRSRDGLDGFETGPRLTAEPIRHHALLLLDEQWYLFWTRVGDRPERILVSELDTRGDWRDWRLGHAQELHRAQRPWEGSDLPADASSYGGVMHAVNQLRDPAIFVENQRIYLLYAVAGEQGIAIGEIRPIPPACG